MGLRGNAFGVFLLVLLTAAIGPAKAGPLSLAEELPDEQAFLNAVRDNMARASRDQVRYAYKERRTEVHTNPFGRLGTGDVALYDVTPGPEPTVTFRKLLERNGQPVLNSKPERHERKVRTQGPSPVDDTVAALNFKLDRRDVFEGRKVIVIKFDPRYDARPQTREGKLAKTFTGRIWVDEAAREVMKVEATALDDLSYGLGLMARVNKGSTVTLLRDRVDEHIWLPTAIRFKGDGRALFALRKLNIDYAVDWFAYRRH